MAYMAQQWLANAVRDAFRERSDALLRAAEAAAFRAWLASLPLDSRALAALDEPIAALEEGMREAARPRPGSRSRRGGPPGGGPPGGTHPGGTRPRAGRGGSRSPGSSPRGPNPDAPPGLAS